MPSWEELIAKAKRLGHDPDQLCALREELDKLDYRSRTESQRYYQLTLLSREPGKFLTEAESRARIARNVARAKLERDAHDAAHPTIRIPCSLLAGWTSNTSAITGPNATAVKVSSANADHQNHCGTDVIGGQAGVRALYRVGMLKRLERMRVDPSGSQLKDLCRLFRQFDDLPGQRDHAAAPGAPRSGPDRADSHPIYNLVSDIEVTHAILFSSRKSSRHCTRTRVRSYGGAPGEPSRPGLFPPPHRWGS